MIILEKNTYIESQSKTRFKSFQIPKFAKIFYKNSSYVSKMIELRRFGKNRLFFVIFRDFQMYVTLRQIDRFFRFSSQIKALFFYFNRLFVEYLLSPLIACYWLIISDYFSSIFPMLNSHKKN